MSTTLLNYDICDMVPYYSDYLKKSYFIMLVGPPGCGKSTFAELLKNRDPNNRWIIISTDAVREEVCGVGHRSDMSRDREVFKHVFERIENGLKSGDNVIYDATNYLIRYRINIMKVASKYATKKLCMVSSLPLSKILMQNANREYSVPEDVVERMYLNLRSHQPTLSEGYDAIARFTSCQAQ